jgi:hypothetical protein
MELLTVISIILLVGAMSTGAYQVAKRNYSFSASAGRIQGVIRAARNTSLGGGTPSFVVIDPVSRTASASAFERVGEWSFDPPADGISVDRTVLHEAAETSGMIGRALDFRSGRAYADCGTESRFDLRTGVAIEAWVLHGLGESPKAEVEEQRGKQAAKPKPRPASRHPVTPSAAASVEPAVAIVEKAGAYFLGMTASGALEGAIGTYRVRTAPGVVTPGRWIRAALRYDGKAIELSADGVPRDSSPPEKRPLSSGAKKEPVPEAAPVTTAPLTISSRDASFPGAIDEVKLSGAVEPLVYTYPEDEYIVGWKKVIHFDSRGRLDPLHHQDPVRIVLIELPDRGPGTAKTAVAVDYSVTFAEWLSRFEAQDMRQSAEEAKLEAQFGSARKIVITVDRLGVVK